MELANKDKDALLKIAKDAIDAKINNREISAPKIDSDRLQLKRGAFVTLKKHGHLRGCIGYIKAYKPLWETVQEMALAAAFHENDVHDF